ncbi:MAG: hypothetical protein L6R42_000866 [Xanthoria sp. 1 TBL-2021]|nr:MAG: hypothetical protein L6R42_000866 [Xanthoria sp. 1 TBL-2021]
MIVNEKQVVESRIKRVCHFTRDIATKAAHTLEACLVRQRAAAHKLQARLTGQNKPDVEKAEAFLLLERAKTHKLAENYKANASSENLTKRKQSTSNASTLVNDEEPESGEIISIRASFANYSHPKATCKDESPAPENGITVTYDDDVNESAIPTLHETIQEVILEQRDGRVRASLQDGEREDGAVGLGERH